MADTCEEDYDNGKFSRRMADIPQAEVVEVFCNKPTARSDGTVPALHLLPSPLLLALLIIAILSLFRL